MASAEGPLTGAGLCGRVRFEIDALFDARLRWLHVHDQLPTHGDGRVPHRDRRR